jgi:periplasmic divalent cation tolerance protein
VVCWTPGSPVGTPDLVVVYVTAPAEKAQDLARCILERKVAACVNILPNVRSLYWWDGKICDDQEQLLVIKSTRAAFERLRAAVVELHPYQVPEVIALPVEAAHLPYAEWVARSVA